MVIFNGAVLDRPLLALLTHLVDTLEEQDLTDCVNPMRRQVFERAMVQERGWPWPLWRLTPWGELTICEVLDLATRRSWSPAMKRRAIVDALAFAGFEKRVL